MTLWATCAAGGKAPAWPGAVARRGGFAVGYGRNMGRSRFTPLEQDMGVAPAVLKAVHRILCEDNGLAALCTQNGWIDNDTLWLEIDHHDAEVD